MRPLSVSTLRDEIHYHNALVVQTKIFHPSGQKLHVPGDVLTLAQAKLMFDLGMKSLYVLEPGEGERGARKTLGVERVPVAGLAAGDETREDIRRPDGELLVPEGSRIVESQLAKIRAEAEGTVLIRRRSMEEEIRQASSYAGYYPPRATRLPRPDTKVTRVTRVSTVCVRPLLVPRGRIFIAVPDELLRSILVNEMDVSGHEVTEFSDPGEAFKALGTSPPDLVVLDFPYSATFCSRLREGAAFRKTAALVYVEADRPSEEYRALHAGANLAPAKPPRRDLLFDAIRACLNLWKRRMAVAPALGADRRAAPRAAARVEFQAEDPSSPRPLALAHAEVRETGPGGLRIEYNVPPGTRHYAYTPHGVHPNHPLWEYALRNPMGRDLSVTLRAGARPPLVERARIVHAEPAGEFEVAGIGFDKAFGPAADFLSGLSPSK